MAYPNKPLLLLRVDVSRQHGTGHLMRCKALADAWVRGGGRVELATTSDLTPYRDWLGDIPAHAVHSRTGSMQDAHETLAIAERVQASWVAADGYHFGSAWQIPFAGKKPLLHFDDYGHGVPHSADLVLNQNPSADSHLYAAAGGGTRLLMGPRYALLRDQFLKLREWKREFAPKARRLLVTFGGTDPVGMTLRAIDVLAGIPEIEAELVVGAGNPSASEIEARCASLPHLHVRKNVTDMPALIAGCDFVLAAAGTTTLECAFLQTPQLLVTVADNQRALAASLQKCGAARHLGWHTEVTAECLGKAIRELAGNPDARTAMGQAGGNLVDGFGGDRVALEMRSRSLWLHEAEPADSRAAWEWANDPDTRAASFSSDPIPWETHSKWFETRLSDPNTRMWIARPAYSERDLGLVRFALDGAEATISIVIDAPWRGAGFGAALIWRGVRELFGHSACQRIHAYIKPDNAASIAAFKKAGFIPQQPTEVGNQPAEHFILERASLSTHELH